MSRYVGATEAARQLGVRKETLYAYVSRGLVERRVAVDGRTSLYAVDDLEQLAGRSRRRDVEPRPSLDVQIATGVTTLDEDGVRYRGHDVGRLARMCRYEQVAELLWTGALPTKRTAVWAPPTADDVEVVRAAVAALGDRRDVRALIAAATALVEPDADRLDAPAMARRLLQLAPVALGERDVVALPLAERLAECWGGADRPAELAAAVDAALVLLADHELATSTLAVRLAASVRSAPSAAFAAGLATILGPLHGSATTAAVEFLRDCSAAGPAATIARRLDGGGRLPGFGHKIYAGDDPRLAPLLDVVASLPDPGNRLALVRSVIAAASSRLVQRPNVDLGLGALVFVADLPDDTPIFAVARIAGFAAHYAEEIAERPVRYRGIARPGR
jgi:citrate synthase